MNTPGEETVDSAARVVPVLISDPAVLECCKCCEPLTIPVFQCDNGHVVCSTCCPNRKTKCHVCSMPISSQRCKAIENLLQSVEVSCPYSCRKIFSYSQKSMHEKECIYVPCYCPFSGCDFVASSEGLSNHFSQKHGESRPSQRKNASMCHVLFVYDYSFLVTLKPDNETIVLQERFKDKKLFILSNTTLRQGNAVSISCIGPNSSKPGYHYTILANSKRRSLKLESFTENVQQGTSATPSSEFLLIPFGYFDSSELCKLEICIADITSTQPAEMQIYVKTAYGKTITMKVLSSDPISNVMARVLDMEGIEADRHSLIFDGKRLQHHRTLTEYYIKNGDTLDIIWCIRGD